MDSAGKTHGANPVISGMMAAECADRRSDITQAVTAFGTEQLAFFAADQTLLGKD